MLSGVTGTSDEKGPLKLLWKISACKIDSTEVCGNKVFQTVFSKAGPTCYFCGPL